MFLTVIVLDDLSVTTATSDMNDTADVTTADTTEAVTADNGMTTAGE